MYFNSLIFLLFFFITTVIYFLIKGKYQRYYLLAVSLIFYSYYIPWHTLILLLLVLMNYFYGVYFEKIKPKNKKIYLILFIILNLSFLIFFKYAKFIDENIRSLSEVIGWNYSLHRLEFLIPIGLSFYIFKCISYNIEVYRNNIPAEKKPDIFSLYIIIYPELISGPIDRPQNLIPQIYETKEFDYRRITYGLKLMAWGYFQKWIIADRLAIIVNEVYDNKFIGSELSFFIATFFFAVQIYCDFSAYSDIAIGIGYILGYKFMTNFNLPYFSRSVSEFWSRWHISLSTWLRDYLFLPIAYSIARRLHNKPLFKIRPEIISYSSAVLTTMVIAGLWHGANTTFAAWGFVMGIYLIFSFTTKKIRKKIIKLNRLNRFKRVHNLISVISTFSLVCISWVFFRASNINEALFILFNIFAGVIKYLSKIPSAITQLDIHIITSPLFIGFNYMDITLLFFFILIFFIIQYIQSKGDIIEMVSRKTWYIRWAIYILLVSLIMIYGSFEHIEFLYAQF